jgi:hypothetical protein
MGTFLGAKKPEELSLPTPMLQTPTTKILAVGTFAPRTDMSQVQRI